MKEIRKNILKSIGIVFYFAVIYLAFTRMRIERLSGDIKIFAGLFLIFGIGMIEKSYKNESGLDAITATELIVLAFHSLSLIYVTKIFEIEFGIYLLYSGVTFSIYYIIKGIVLYTKGKREELKKLSDISEIVKEEPVKKEATKKNKKEKQVKSAVSVEENEEKENKGTKTESQKKEAKVKKKSTTKKATTKKSKSVKNTEVKVRKRKSDDKKEK